MSVSLSIHPSTDRLHMYGEPNAASAYSLSGHVSISISPSSSFLNRRRTARYLLKSLSLTFDGQTEIFTPIIGYSAVRLCSATRELIASEDPLELTNEGQEDSEGICVWNIIFDITLPGWLPATSSLGDEHLGVTYGLYATAKLLDLDGTRNKPWSLTTLCVPFLSRTKTVYARRAIEIERFVAPPPRGDCAVGAIHYQVSNLSISGEDATDGQKKIPSGVLEKVQVVLSVPEYIDMCQTGMEVALKMKVDELEQEERERLRLLKVSLVPSQVEMCRVRPSRNYVNRSPLPPQSQQPPNTLLLNPSSIGAVYEANILPLPDRTDSVSRTFSLLSSRKDGRFKPSDEQSRVSADDTTVWTGMGMTVPLNRPSRVRNDWDIPKVIRPSGSSPLFVVQHEMAVSITCAYAFPDSDEIVEGDLNFTIPLSFGKFAPPPPQPPLPSSVSRTNFVRNATAPSLPIVEPYAPTLPVYSQLYHSNGEEKVDYSVPLPLYSPPCAEDQVEGAGHYSARMSALEENSAGMKGLDASRPIDMDDLEAPGDEETTPLLEARAT